MQIQGFSAGLYQIEWLLVTIVILYLVIMDLPGEGPLGVLVTMLEVAAIAACQLLLHLLHSDIPARYGGDELVVLLPETDSVGGKNMMERLINAAKDQQQYISIGVAAYPEHGDSFEELLDHADSAMYFSKSPGGNRVSVQAVA